MGIRKPKSVVVGGQRVEFHKWHRVSGSIEVQPICMERSGTFLVYHWVAWNIRVTCAVCADVRNAGPACDIDAKLAKMTAEEKPCTNCARIRRIREAAPLVRAELERLTAVVRELDRKTTHVLDLGAPEGVARSVAQPSSGYYVADDRRQAADMANFAWGAGWKIVGEQCLVNPPQVTLLFDPFRVYGTEIDQLNPWTGHIWEALDRLERFLEDNAETIAESES